MIDRARFRSLASGVALLCVVTTGTARAYGNRGRMVYDADLD